jgi:hypothetical protein
MRKFAIAFVVLSCLVAAGCVRRVLESAPAHSVPADVPEPYRAIYGELDAELHRQIPLIPSPWGTKTSETAFGVELLAANSHRGEALLEPSARRAAAVTLDRLKTLGVQSVSLSIHYPLLTRNQPRAPEYREFYRELGAEIRKRGLKIVVELGSAFREPEFSRLKVDYSGLTRARFSAGLRETAEAVIADIGPDWLTVLSEPDTQSRNTDLPFSPEAFAATVQEVVQGLKRGGVSLGAGAGTWTSSDYFRALARIPELDYLDLHIYPIHHGFAAERALKAREIAQDRGKGISIGEAWLYKVAGRELGRITPVEAISRDAFSFWQTLDDHFIEMVVNLARTLDARFCSFFWMTYLYAYVDHTAETARLPPGELMALGDRLAAENILKGRPSATGERFRQLIAQ